MLKDDAYGWIAEGFAEFPLLLLTDEAGGGKRIGGRESQKMFTDILCGNIRRILSQRVSSGIGESER